MGLRWEDIDLLSGVIAMARSQHGRSRRVPMKSVTRSVLLDLGSARQHPDEPTEPVFALRPGEAPRSFSRARFRVPPWRSGRRASGHAPRRVHAARQSAHLRIEIRNSGSRPADDQGGWWAADTGDGAALCAPHSVSSPRRCRAACRPRCPGTGPQLARRRGADGLMYRTYPSRP
jgi:hypothetical protein